MTEQQTLLPMDSGEALRVRRLELDLSLRQVAEQIKCPPHIIEALEQDEPVELAAVYLRGHIKRYCDLLEVNPEVQQQLLDSHTNESPGVQTVFETRPRVRTSDRWLRVASYVLASLLVGTLAWQVTHEAVRLTSVDTPESLTEQPGLESDTGTSQHVNASIASLENLQGPAGSRTGNAGLQAWRAIDEARQATGGSLGQGAHVLVLETSADSWVEITGANDDLLEQDLLRGGESRQYSDDGPFRISLGRSSAVKLTLDGEAIDLAPYTRDDVARLLLEPKTTRPDSTMENKQVTANSGSGPSIAESVNIDEANDTPPSTRPVPEG